MFKDLPTTVLSLLETLLSIDPEQRGSAARALESECDLMIKSLIIRTGQFACDPSSLPKYPPSKEFDAKLRDEAKRQQRPTQEKQDSQTRRSHERKLISPNPYLRTCIPGNSTRQMQSQRTRPAKMPQVEESPTQNAAARILSSRGSSRGQSGSCVDTIASDQRIMGQQKKNLRAFNITDTMDSSKRQIKIPNDPSWYDSGDNKMYMSGPLSAQPSKMDQMLEEHDRQLQEFTRQRAKQSRN
ncbi:hypothetical protein N665_0222s0016 [Sinapis alba]|nr:hypothetical protein N665_0222s0016 [Sinapis alba]